MRCPKCGSEQREGDHFCGNCGFMLKTPSQDSFKSSMPSLHLIYKKSENKNRRGVFFIIGAISILTILIALFRTKNEPDFLCNITRTVQKGIIFFNIDITTEPEIKIDYRSQVYTTNTDGRIIIVIPSSQVSLNSHWETIILFWQNKKVEKKFWVDNAAIEFNFPEEIFSIHITDDGQKFFLMEVPGMPNSEITVNSLTLDSPGSTVYQMKFNVTKILPEEHPTIDTLLHVNIKDAHSNPYQGFLNLKLTFPATGIQFESASGVSVKWGQGDIVSFVGASLVVMGKVTYKEENTIVRRVTANGIPIQLQEDGSFKATFKGLSLGRNEIQFKGEADGHTPGSKTLIAIREPTNSERVAEYRRNTESISYPMLSKNPDRYKGKRVVVLGRIFTIKETNNSSFMQVHVSNTGSLYGWEDQIIVTYPFSTEFVDRNFVWICGKVEGSYTYTSVAGLSITAPHISAEYIGKFEGELGQAIVKMLKKPF